MKIKAQHNFILKGLSPSSEKQLVFSRQLLKKKGKQQPKQRYNLQEVFSRRLNTSKQQELYRQNNNSKSQKSRFNSKDSLQALKQLQRICQDSKMMNITSRLLYSRQQQLISPKTQQKHSRFIEFSLKRRKSFIQRRSQHQPLFQRSTSQNASFSLKPQQKIQTALPDLKVMNSFNFSKGKLGQARKKKRYHLVHI